MNQSDSRLPIARYRFEWEVTDTIHFPEFSGSMLRGVFGQGLRTVVCIAPKLACKECSLIGRCPFPALFSPHDIPRKAASFGRTIHEIPVPYVIEPPAWGKETLKPGQRFAFTMVLIGGALQHLNTIIIAWKQAMSIGLGPSQGKARLCSVAHQPGNDSVETVYRPESGEIVEHPQHLTVPEFSSNRTLILKIDTIMKLQSRKKPLSAKQLNASILIRHLLRRTSFLGTFHMADMELANPDSEKVQRLNALSDRLSDDRSQLGWREFKRYSGRQGREMTMGGVYGKWKISNVPPEVTRFLYLGQWLHIGANATFGLGGYSLLNEQERPMIEEMKYAPL